LSTTGVNCFDKKFNLLPVVKKALHEITVNSQGYLDPFSRIVGFSVTPQRHIMTSPDT